MESLTPDWIEKLHAIRIKTIRLAQDTLAGQYHSAFKGVGMNFAEVREYQIGDDVRTIDWNVSARMQGTFVKRFEEERELTVMLLVDMSASQILGSKTQSKRELAAEMASVLAFSALMNNDRVGLMLFSSEVEHMTPPRKGQTHVLRLIRDILHFEPRHSGTSLTTALLALHAALPRRALVFLFSDFLDVGYEPALRAVARRHDLVCLPVFDSGEQDLPRAGRVTFEDVETGELLELDTHRPATRARFAARATQRRQDLRKLLRTCGVDSVESRTGEPYQASLSRFFRSRSRRR